MSSLPPGTGFCWAGDLEGLHYVQGSTSSAVVVTSLVRYVQHNWVSLNHLAYCNQVGYPYRPVNHVCQGLATAGPVSRPDLECSVVQRTPSECLEKTVTAVHLLVRREMLVVGG